MPMNTELKAAAGFRKTDDTFTPGAKTLPQRYFVSPQVFAEEEVKIFGRQWVCVGHQSEVAKTGDYFAREVARQSLILVRDQAQAIRAFHNVCRHRGTRICEKGSGHAAALQCPYHAWTYALDGSLRRAPQMETVDGFERADYPLRAVALELWEGFIFVSLAPAPAPFAETFAPLAGKFSDWNLSQLRSGQRIEYDVRANWKLIFENYSECYHCPLVHPALAKVSPYDSAENDLSEGPFLGGFMRIAKGRSLTMSGNACALPLGTGGDEARVFYYSIFPNLLLSMHPDYVIVHRIWPQSPERTVIVCDWFFHPAAFKRADFRPEDAVEFWDMTNRQDWHVCELSQKGISSRAYTPGPYSPRESIPAAWDREYLRHVD
jgi:Rieske 2Fe-2S family protein